MHWCPRCRGVLLSPGPVDAPPERRNYRWVARKPDHRPARNGRRPQRDPRSGPPRYTEIPRWGLIDVPRPAAAEPAGRLDRAAASVRTLLLWTAIAFGGAALAELGRYLVLLYNRTRLVPPVLLHVSDAAVIGLSIVAQAVAVLAAVAAVGRLIQLRRAAYARLGRSDPRPVRTLVLGCLVPVANLVWPGVFLTELLTGRDDPRTLRLIRLWWAVWVLSGVMVLAALFWRRAESLQAQADGVVFTALTDAVAAGVALLTLAVLNALEGRDLRGRARSTRRWTVAVDPAVPVIEPLHPGSGERPAAAPGENTGDALADKREQKREQEEVGAK